MSIEQSQYVSKKRQTLVEEVTLPQGVSAEFKDGIMTITGPLGKVSEDFSKIPVELKVEAGKVQISTVGARRKNQSVIKTAGSIIKNAIHGVTKGYEYRLKVIFAHFPMAVKVQVQGEDIKVTGPSIKDVGQTAANIEQATTVKRKDQRVFLDGVYVYERIRR